MFYRATTVNHGPQSEFDEGRCHEDVDPERGPLVHNVGEDGHAWIRPAPNPTVCFAETPAQAVVGMLSAGSPTERRVVLYATERSPDVDLRDTPGVQHDVPTMDCDVVDRVEWDFDLLGEVRYENPAEEPVPVFRVGVYRVPSRLRQAVDAAYDNGIYRERVQRAIRIAEAELNVYDVRC